MPDPLLLRRSQVATAIGMSERWINRAAAAGEFPKPLRIGVAARWELSAVRAWIQSKKEAAGDESAASIERTITDDSMQHV
jgi:predicted DNA-binding transcriptional regulator AlpA